MIPSSSSKANNRLQASSTGFTLVEILVALGVFSIVGAAAVAFSVSMLNVILSTEKKNEINRTTRHGIQLLDSDARAADFLIVHSGLTSSLIAASSRSATNPQPFDTVRADRLPPNQSGDLLILGYVNEALHDTSHNRIIFERMVCYFRRFDPNTGKTPLLRYEVSIPDTFYNLTDIDGIPGPDDEDNWPPIESFLPAPQTNDARIIFEDTSIPPSPSGTGNAAFLKMIASGTSRGAAYFNILTHDFGTAYAMNASIQNFLISTE